MHFFLSNKNNSLRFPGTFAVSFSEATPSDPSFGVQQMLLLLTCSWKRQKITAGLGGEIKIYP